MNIFQSKCGAIRVRLLCGLALAVCLIGAGWLFFYFFPWSSRAHISGVVVDDATNKPVPNARLIISAQRWGFPYNFMVAKYGVETNEDGKFSLDITPPRRFNDLIIEASGPSNSYGHLESYGEANGLVIRTFRIPKVLEQMRRLYYDNFSGSAPYMGVKEIEFIGEGWPVE